jgi:PAS domain S-box-containing protein
MLNGFAYCRMIFDHNQPQDFTYIEVNTAFETLTGLKNVVGKRATEVIPGIRKADPGLFEIYGRVALTGIPERFEAYVEALGMWFAISVYSPAKEHFVALFDVITERKQAEEELKKHREHLEELVEEKTAEIKESEGKFRELYEGSRDGYVLVDMEGYIKEFNHAYQQMLGYAEEELYKLTYEDLTSAKWHAMEAQILKEQIIPRGYSDIYEKEYMKKDHTVFPVELRTYLIRDKNGKPSGMWAFIRDITKRKRAEEEIQKLNKENEQRLGDLTVVNKELEAFSYSVSHDLRAPLRSIDGFSLALLEDYIDRLDETGKNYFHRIRSAVQKMSELIDGLLILSRLTRTELRQEPVDLSDMTKHLIIELQNRQPDRPVKFVIAEGATTHGDALMLRVALQNLLGNAWKFTRKHPTAMIEFGMMESDGQEATDKSQTIFYVRDDGAGFDMAYSDKLFGAFQRLHSNVDFPGIGIGLTTVQRIIHRHGGRIWAKGELEKGATFYFTLP